MDLGTIEHKLNGGVYPGLKELSDDVHLVFDNAVKYNGKVRQGPLLLLLLLLFGCRTVVSVSNVNS